METYTIPGVIGGHHRLHHTAVEDVRGHDLGAAAAGACGGGRHDAAFHYLRGRLVQRRITRFSNRYVTISGKGIRARPFQLGRWRPWLVALLALYAFATVICR